jgi:hypothetical protein
MNTMQDRNFIGGRCLLVSVLVLLSVPAWAVPVVAPEFAGVYTIQSLGAVPGLPTAYGGLTFIDDDTLLIGGHANEDVGRLYTIDVTRDGDGHVVGFAGMATEFGAVGEYNDGGVVFGPGGVLFTTRWPTNELGQTRPSEADEARIDDLGALGVTPSPGGMTFVPGGLPGAGQLKIVSWEGGEWYTLTLAPAGDGTYDIISATPGPVLPGGPEGIAYVPTGSPLFLDPSVLISEFSAGNVAVYSVDAGGNPMVASRRDFVIGLVGAEGALVDPVTGDFLFSTFGVETGDEVLRVQGFVPPPPVPEPASLTLLGIGLAALAFARRRRTSREQGREEALGLRCTIGQRRR